MTSEQLDRLSRLLADTAQTASTIELRALADHGGQIARWAGVVRGNCVACMRLVDGLSEEVGHE